MTDRIDAARERMANVVFESWSKEEIDVFVRLIRKFADALEKETAAGAEPAAP
jgi:hypothetical protein